MTSPQLLRAALEYVARGWRVFPCRPGRKEPLFPVAHPEGDRQRGRCRGECGRLGHGCHDATTDADVICRWWRARPTANVAIATGAPGPDVVDVDVKDGRGGLAAMERLRVAGLLAGPLVLVQTPSAGLHLYYLGSDQGNGKIAKHGVDFRSHGGYVVAAPSVVNGTPYEILEQRSEGRGVDWPRIRRFLDPPRPTRPAPSRPTSGDIGRLARWVAELAEGNRNDGLFWAACRAVEDGRNDLDALVSAACAAGLSESEARRTVDSASGRLRHG